MPRVMKFRTDYLKFFSSDISLFGIDSGTIEKNLQFDLFSIYDAINFASTSNYINQTCI